MLDRRHFLTTLPALAAVPRALLGPRAAPLAVLGIHHATLAVSDVGRSVEFYQALFGLAVQARRGSSVALRLGEGPRFLALEPAGGRPPRIVELGLELEVEGLRNDRVIAALGAHRAATTLEADGPTLLLSDPAGLRVRLVRPGYCGGDGCTALDPALGGAPLALRDLSHLTISVPDPSREVAFYRETFGLDVQTMQATIPALGVGPGVHFLMFIPGRESGIHHVCFALEGFGVERIQGALESRGLRPRGQGAEGPLEHWVSLRMPNRGGALEGTPELYFSDPDGLVIQLQDAGYCGGGGRLGDECRS